MKDGGSRKHLKHLDFVSSEINMPIFYITLCSYQRRPILANSAMFPILKEAFEKSAKINGWTIGRFVIMPDHVQFFCAQISNKKTLAGFIRDFKRWTTGESWKNGLDGKIWQDEFFDHLLRDGESYEEKWKYVLMNPARNGLCESHEEWLFQGECEKLTMHSG